MTQFCTCDEPKPAAHESGTPVCGKCGLWWDKRYGSKRPKDNPNWPLDEVNVSRAFDYLKKAIRSSNYELHRNP